MLPRALTVAAACLAVGAGEAGAAVNVYSSLPRQGTSAEQTRAVEQGIRLALRDAGGAAGGEAVNYIPLDDSSRANPGTADEAQTRRNARRVAADPLAIAYIGEFNSGGTKVSLPILNRVPLLQVSPSNTYVGLTAGGPGAQAGEPGRYYPTGRRTYARIVPHDGVQADALATLARQARCRSTSFVADGSGYGDGIVRRARAAASRLRLRTAGTATVRSLRPAALRALARRVRGACVIYGGTTFNGAAPTLRALAVGRPGRRFFASDGVGENGFARALPARVARRTLIAVATLAPRDLPPAGRSMLARWRDAFGARYTDPYAAYGYESMRVVLEAIGRAAPRTRDRGAVIDAFFAGGVRRGVLGDYSIDANGDTTSRAYGVYGIDRRRIVYRRAVYAL